MKLLSSQLGDSLRRGLSQYVGGDADPRMAAELSEYRLQVQLLRTRSRRLERQLADVAAANKAALADKHRTEMVLRERLAEAQASSAFESAWEDFNADNSIEDQLSHLDAGDDRARRWLLTPGRKERRGASRSSGRSSQQLTGPAAQG